MQLFAGITEWLFSNISPFSFPMIKIVKGEKLKVKG